MWSIYDLHNQKHVDVSCGIRELIRLIDWENFIQEISGIEASRGQIHKIKRMYIIKSDTHLY